MSLTTLPTTNVGQYEYYALHQRSVKRADTDIANNGLDQQRVYYYDASWRIVEEQIDDDYVNNPGDNRRAEELWGVRYIDDPRCGSSGP
jgi:hypothetical protein